MNKKSYCPFCCDYYEFLPFGIIKRPNAQCPNCLSLERYRDDLIFLKNNTSIFNNARVIYLLHTSPEKCFFNIFNSFAHIKYFSINIDRRDNLSLIRSDVQYLPFKDRSFNVIYSCHVLEHVANDILVLKEFYRVLKSNGFALINIPIKTNLKKTLEEPWINTPELREKYYGQYDHLRLYGQDFINKLNKVGFLAKRATDTSFICYKS